MSSNENTSVSISHLQKIMDFVPGIICIIDANGLIQFINKEAQRILGYTEHDLLGHNCVEFVVDQDRNRTKRIFSFLSAGLENLKFHNRCISKNGKVINLTWICKWCPEENQIYCTGQHELQQSGVHILQRKFERKVKEQQKDLYDILERIEEGFIALDEEDRVIYWNRQAEIISGIPREEVLTRNIFEYPPGALQSDLVRLQQKAKREQTPQHHESYFAETEKWLAVTMYPSKRGLTCFFRDITEQKLLEEHLETQKKENQKKITAAVIQAQEKERSLVGLELHDNINQVLTTIKLYIELSISGIGGKELMEKSVGLLQDCINEIRVLSKKLSAPTLGSIRMKDSIMELVDAIASTGKAAITLDIEEIHDLDVPAQIHLAIYRILQEHLTNILKHAEATQVRIIIQHIDEELVLKVVDNGVGFNTGEKKKGIGISNMISRAESLGGRLYLNSAPNLGCVLIVQISLGE